MKDALNQRAGLAFPTTATETLPSLHKATLFSAIRVIRIE